MGAIKGKQLETMTCPMCSSFSSKRITNVEKHLKIVHNSSLKDEYDKKFGAATCACGCKKEPNWTSWKLGYCKFIVGHNASIHCGAYTPEEEAKLSLSRGSNWRGKPGAWLGKTKETDEKTKKRADATALGRQRALDEGKITIWSKGKTKETDARVAAFAKQIKDDFSSGDRVAWSAGLSEKSDDRIKKKNDALRQKYANGELTSWHKGKTAKDDDRLSKAWLLRNPVKEYANTRWSDEEIKNHLQNNIQLALERIEGYRNDRKPALHVRCRSCGWEAKVAYVFAKVDRCPTCQPVGSSGQHQIANWIESFGIKTGRNVKGIIGRQELDVLVPAHKFAVEFNGLYYHNEQAGKDKNFHQNKTNKCKELGISLFHVFEDEWLHKQDIVKSMLLHRFGRTPSRIFARKCTIVQLSSDERKRFFSTNHIDGDVIALATYALKHNDEIVIALSIRKKFHGKKNNHSTYEVARCCNKTFTNVVGGVSRLVTQAIKFVVAKNGEELVTYVDTRFGGNGKGYADAGFKLSETTEPRFWWTDNHKRFNRLKFKANKPAGLTEAQVAEAAGVAKIWGCKNLTYKIKLVQSVGSSDVPSADSSAERTPS